VHRSRERHSAVPRGTLVILRSTARTGIPVATAQLALHQELLPHLERFDAVILGSSVDGTWSHREFARVTGIRFPLLSDDKPPGH
jgi:peroxiredoxin